MRCQQATLIMGDDNANSRETTPATQRALRKQQREESGRGRGKGRGRGSKAKRAEPTPSASSCRGRGGGRGRGKKAPSQVLKRPAGKVTRTKEPGKGPGCPKCRDCPYGCRTCNPEWRPRRARRADSSK